MLNILTGRASATKKPESKTRPCCSNIFWQNNKLNETKMEISIFEPKNGAIWLLFGNEAVVTSGEQSLFQQHATGAKTLASLKQSYT